MTNNGKGAMVALLAFGLFSLHDVLVKLLGGTYSPIQILFFNVLFCFPLFSLTLIRHKRSGSLRPNRPFWTAVRTISVVITGFSSFTAFALLPMTQTYALLFTMPLLITLLSIPMLGEKVGLHRGLAIIAGLVGVLIVLRPTAEPLSLGHIAGIVAAFGAALSSVIVRRIGQHERAAVLLLYPLLANLAVMGVLLPFVYEPMPIEHLGMLAAIATFSLIATALTIRAYQLGEAAVVAPMQYSQIILATIFGWLVFSEKPDLVTLLGAGVVIASGVYVVLRESRVRSDGNQPVLNTRTRFETGVAPRVGTLIDTAEDSETSAR